MKNMFIVLFLLVGSVAYAQSTEGKTGVVGNEPLLQEITSLSQLAADVNATQKQVDASAASSRAAGVTAKENFTTACNAYLAELKKQHAASTNASLTDALKREIALVEKLLAPQTNSNR
ncbi:MAG TPA: hypothetical protein VK826_15495 [Bacteroidia bacterium]|nr:hypothetical protein [Bacteroidia bacterium]